MDDANKLPTLPERRTRRTRSGPELMRIELTLKTVTPILGGAHKPRHTDDQDPIRVPSVAGHLRFWWRAIYGAGLSAATLAERESTLWGTTAGTGGASLVSLSVTVTNAGTIDRENVSHNTRGGYALFPASAQQGGVPPAPRREHVEFKLTVSLPEPYEAEVKNALKAWLWFGGVGGRTRRGLGAITATGASTSWLPENSAEVTAWFKSLGAASTATDLPSLRGATLFALTGPTKNAWDATVISLDALKAFRQGTHTGARNARNGPTPGQSNWPESDKLRHLHLQNRGRLHPHRPRHNANMAWPRAQFGLPIVGKFKTGPGEQEPGQFELVLTVNGTLRDRLASPLLLRALPLRNGRFVPIALWLHRANPAQAQVGPRHATQKTRLVDGSAAPFTRMKADGDTDLTRGLLGTHTSMRDAFGAWLVSKNATKVIG